MPFFKYLIHTKDLIHTKICKTLWYNTVENNIIEQKQMGYVKSWLTPVKRRKEAEITSLGDSQVQFERFFSVFNILFIKNSEVAQLEKLRSDWELTI